MCTIPLTQKRCYNVDSIIILAKYLEPRAKMILNNIQFRLPLKISRKNTCTSYFFYKIIDIRTYV